MNNNKLATLLLAAAVPGVAFGKIALTDSLTVGGFIDSSYLYEDGTGGATWENETIGIDAVDVDFMFDTESVSAEVHLAAPGGNNVGVEQAFFTYDLGGGASVTAGKYLSLHGYEGDEPYKLYQQSYAFNYSTRAADAKIPFAAYHSGIKAAYSTGDFSAVISLVDSVYTNDGDANDVGYEAQIKYTGLEGFVFAIGTAQDDQNAAAGIDEYWNFWVEYSGIDKLILAAEYNNYEHSMMDADSWMLMANYSVSDKVAATLRYSDTDEDQGYEADKWTIAPSYSFSDNLLGVLEYSQSDIGTTEVDYFAVEALWTF